MKLYFIGLSHLYLSHSQRVMRWIHDPSLCSRFKMVYQNRIWSVKLYWPLSHTVNWQHDSRVIKERRRHRYRYKINKLDRYICVNNNKYSYHIVFFNIQVKNFIWCFSILSFMRSLIIKIYSTIDDLLSKIVWEIFRYSHCMCFFHDYIFWAFCNIILILNIRHRKLKINLLFL